MHGLVVGYHRERILEFARRRTGQATLVVIVTLYLGMLFFTWNNPYLSNVYDVRIALIPEETFDRLYFQYFERRFVELGRLAAVALFLVTAYAFLSAYWKPVNRALGWFLVPLGQATLYVFILHVYFTLVVANVPPLTRGHVLLNTLAHALVLAALWFMVKRRVLFRLIPR